jgi:hypothetical protein
MTVVITRRLPSRAEGQEKLTNKTRNTCVIGGYQYQTIGLWPLVRKIIFCCCYLNVKEDLALTKDYDENPN